ncbi:cupin domain-containing protein, partial [Pseudactinotalea sp.]|uniref:cupin domain-containing protein n=1 Tax=Pseudactinotalea sp. TaxID=1926260 RepID=UPI003B3A58BD
MTVPELRLNDSQTLRVLAATDRELHVESTWMPGEPPRTHWHPHPVETFYVLAGELTVEVGGHPSRTL